MANYPNRCQHLKINGTQCGSPALRRNRFCFFHKRYQDERIRLGADRARRGSATFILPVLEDADSIQMAIMQVMRMLVSGQIEHKTASLLLYALQTASSNLHMTRFSPLHHQVILDPRAARDTPLDSNVWSDADFDDEEDEEELDPVEAEAEEAARRAAVEARRQVHANAARRERARKTQEDEDYLKKWILKHPENMLVRRDGRLVVEPKPKPPEPETKKPAASTRPEEIRAQIVGMVHDHLPELTKAYVKATEAEKKSTE